MSTPAPLPILLIEDERSVMSFLCAALATSGYATTPATSAEEGLAMLESRRFKGVISDMRTPGPVNGADVYRWISQHRPELAHRLLFITGDILNEETANVLQQTGVPCIEKPFRLSQLVEKVRTVIGDAR